MRAGSHEHSHGSKTGAVHFSAKHTPTGRVSRWICVRTGINDQTGGHCLWTQYCSVLG